MKLSRISVNGYKNLIDCVFELSNFNVLIGPNNSGKSNLLELFTFLDLLVYGSDESKSAVFDGYIPELGSIITECENVNPRNLFIEVEYYEIINEATYNYVYTVELAFNTKEYKSETIVNNHDGHIINEAFRYKNINLPGRMNTVFERDISGVRKLPGQIIQNVDKTEPVISLISKIRDIKDVLKVEVQKGIELLNVVCKTPIIYNSPSEIRDSYLVRKENLIMHGKIIALPLSEEIFKVVNSEKRGVYQDILNEVLDIEEISATDSQNFKFITITYSNGMLCTLNQLSDGTLVVLSIITYLFSKKSQVIAIEELENSLHPKLLKKMVYLLKNDFSNTQIIITTHSPVLLNLVQVEDVSIITNNEFGAASIFRVKDKKEMVRKLNNPLSSFGDIFYI